MHIAFLTPEYPTQSRPEGGLAAYLQKVSVGLVERGHSVTVVVTGPDLDAQSEENAISLQHVRQGWLQRLAQCLPGSIGKGLALMGQVQTARRVARRTWQVHRCRPIDIIQTSSYLTPGYALRRNGSIPLVCRLSSYTPLYRAASGRKRSLYDHWTEWLEIRQVLDADAAFAPSMLIARSFARLEGRLPDVIRTPLDRVQTSGDIAANLEELRDRRYLLYFGRLNRAKGVDLIGEILPQLLDRHPDLTIVCVGRDEGMPSVPSLGAYLRQRATAFPDRLILSPSLAKELLYSVIADAYGVLLPSRVDNYPNACLEALMLGIPVIGTYESSLDEIIVHGKTGFLAENGSAASLSAAIEQLLALSVEEYEAMQQMIRETVATIRVEDRLGQLIDYYEQVIADFHRPSQSS